MRTYTRIASLVDLQLIKLLISQLLHLWNSSGRIIINGFKLQSGNPISSDPRNHYLNDWQTGMCHAPCANPLWFTISLFCPCPMASYVRRLSLGNEMAYYKCCQVRSRSKNSNVETITDLDKKGLTVEYNLLAIIYETSVSESKISIMGITTTQSISSSLITIHLILDDLS